jgi:EAL domain-containing protein (putative c-di-GMP-specific phosphodiesterase class I)
MLGAALRDAGCPASALVVEITETALMDDLQVAVRTLDAIKALGLRLDLDDFGTGSSSLISLKRCPVDRIKIDQSFVAGLGSNHAGTLIVASTIALAHAVGLTAIAEGVETLDQLQVLRRMGCDYVQGHQLSRPLEADALTSWLAMCGAHTRALAGRGGAVGAVRGPVVGAGHELGRPRRAVADGPDGKPDRRDAAADRP